MKENNNWQEGETYKTVGGWEAKIVYIPCPGDTVRIYDGFWVVHKPNTEENSYPVWHDLEGVPGATLSINEPPLFDSQHPATMIYEDKGT